MSEKTEEKKGFWASLKSLTTHARFWGAITTLVGVGITFIPGGQVAGTALIGVGAGTFITGHVKRNNKTKEKK